MKVLMIEHFLPGSIYTLELTRELKRYCDLTVFCREDAGVQEEGIRWMPRWYPGGKTRVGAAFAYGMSLFALGKMIRGGGFDVVHIQSFKHPGSEIRFYRRMRRHLKQLVFTVHNVLPHEAGPGDFRLFQGFYKLCDALIVHNEASKQCLMKRFSLPEQRIAVIAHGVYGTHLERADQPGEGPSRQGIVKEFLQFGFIRAYKGIDILLEAVAAIRPEQRRFIHVTIAGQKFPKLDKTDYGAKIRELGIEQWVSFLPGHVPDEKVAGLFQQADFILFPYRNIYGSGALMMAYTYGKPVIASDIPPFLEETDGGKTGILFKSQDPKALADAIIEAAGWEEDRLRACRQAIGRLAEEKYNWKVSAEKTAGLYAGGTRASQIHKRERSLYETASVERVGQ